MQELQDARLRAERGGRGGASEAQGSGMESDQMPSVELELAGMALVNTSLIHASSPNGVWSMCAGGST